MTETMTTLAPEELRLTFSSDDGTETSDVDNDILQMSVSAMKILDSITDEVAELSKPRSSRSLNSTPATPMKSSSSSSLPMSPSSARDSGRKSLTRMQQGRRTEGDETPTPAKTTASATPPPIPASPAGNNNSGSRYVERVPVTPSPNLTKKKIIKHIDDLEDDDEDDMTDDGSIARELGALMSVTKEIEQELSRQDTLSMHEAIARIEKSPEPKMKEILGSDDKEIIRKVLDDEMRRYQPKNGLESLLKRLQLEGIREEEVTYALATSAVVVWSIVLRLAYKIMYEEF